MNSPRKLSLLSIIGPGILVAATGVGAGDLATGAFTGSKLGLAVLWAVVVGAFLKFVLNEGLARWQLATGDTFLEGAVTHFGRVVNYAFLVYLLIWSFFVASALMSACGVTAHAILPMVLPSEIKTSVGGQEFTLLSGKILFGLLHSAVAVVLVLRGGYKLFERVMSVCIAVMFVTVVATAVGMQPSWSDFASGLFVPSIPDFRGEGLAWTVALMGGVGGTLTILCYGYWIREEGRTGAEDLRTCRIDLATGYAMTAIFGVSMIVIGGRIEVTGTGSKLIVQLAEQLRGEFDTAGPLVQWAFLLGAWGAVFSSQLGVWQSVPYLFADFRRISKGIDSNEPIDARDRGYRWYLFGLATIPAIGLWVGFQRIQLLYAVVGALCMPMLALALLILNGREQWVGARFRNSKATTLLLAATLVFFLLAGAFAVQENL